MTPEQQERVHRMEQVGLMAAGISHDFNNTAQCMLGEMTTIEVRLQELSRISASGTAPDPSRLERLIADCRRALSIIDSGLQAAVASNREIQRIFRGEPAGRSLAGTDLRRAAERALRLVSGRLRPVAELRNGDKIQVAVSEDTLVRVLLNLLINASDAFPEGAAEPRVRLHLRVVGARAFCDVIDNGPGVPPDILPRLFEPFVTGKPAGSGTGLGLAVSRQLIRAAGGDLHLVETGRSGTVLRLTVPVVAAGETSGDEDDPLGLAHFFSATLREPPEQEERSAGTSQARRRLRLG